LSYLEVVRLQKVRKLKREENERNEKSLVARKHRQQLFCGEGEWCSSSPPAFPATEVTTPKRTGKLRSLCRVTSFLAYNDIQAGTLTTTEC